MTTGKGRKQELSIATDTRRDGKGLIRVSTRCGARDDTALSWALRANKDVTHCAMSLCKEGDEEFFDLVSSTIASETSPEEIKAAVKEVAFYGDWIENKLTGSDEF